MMLALAVIGTALQGFMRERRVCVDFGYFARIVDGVLWPLLTRWAGLAAQISCCITV